MLTKRTFIALLLIGIALFERLVFDFGPNVELITLTALVAAYYLGGNYAWLVPLASLAISDFFIGNTHIFIFTWSAYMLIGGGGLLLRRFKTKALKLTAASGFYSIGSALFFFAWTNFGVWLLSSLYPKSLAGLTLSYYMGLPFLKWNLASNLLIVPTGFLAIETLLLWRLQVRRSRALNLNSSGSVSFSTTGRTKPH